MSDPTPKPPATSLQQRPPTPAPAAAAGVRPRNKVRADRVKPGDLMALVHFVRVLEVTPDGESMTVRDLDHTRGDIDVSGRSLIESTLSADQYEGVVRVSMTRAAEVLVESHNR